jgi:hypothetical protein
MFGLSTLMGWEKFLLRKTYARRTRKRRDWQLRYKLVTVLGEKGV